MSPQLFIPLEGVPLTLRLIVGPVWRGQTRHPFASSCRVTSDRYDGRHHVALRGLPAATCPVTFILPVLS